MSVVIGRRAVARKTINLISVLPVLLALAPFAVSISAGAQPAPRETIRLVYHPQVIPSFARDKPELFADVLAKQGVDVKWVDVQGSHAPAIAAVIGGSADLTFGGTTSVALTSAANGQDVVIAGLANSILTNGGIVAYPNSGINSIKDLRGKTVAVNRGGFGELTLVSALLKAGIPRSEVNFVFLSIPDGAAAFAAKKVDAYAALTSGVQTATIDYGAKLIFDIDKNLTSDESIVAGNSLAFVTTGAYAAKHKDVLRKVIAAYKNVAEWTASHTDEAFEITQRINNYPKSIRSAVKAQTKGYVVYYPLTDSDIALQQKSADFLFANKVLPKPLDVKKYFGRY